MSFVLVLIGGVITCFSWWLLLHISDRKLLRRLRPRWNSRMSKEEAVAYRSTNLAMVAIIIMVMGSMILIAGLTELLRS